MNREIEFRGIVSEDREQGIHVGCWVYGDLEYNRVSNKARIHVYDGNGNYYGQYTVDPDTVGQFTGLFDKRDVKIFEGDIVCKRDLTFNLEYKGVVVYNSAIGCFRIHSESQGTTMRMGFKASSSYNDGQCTVPVKYEYEVIGSILDNPELLVTE